ncbi:MAG: SGNH/GDSL hydrolase family protein [Candidatus Nanopelagicales bacterium]
MTTRWQQGALAASVTGVGALLAALLPGLVSPAAAVAPNLLTANQASIENSLAGIEHGYNAETLARTTAHAAAGVASVSLTSTKTTGMALRTTPRSAVAGQAYSASAVVRTASGTQPALVQLRFWSATGAALGVSNGTTITATATAWTRASRVAAVAPAGTATVSVHVVVQAPKAAVTAYADELGLWQSSTLPAWSLPGATAAPTTSAPAPTPTTSTTAPVPLVSAANRLTPNQASLETSTSGLEPSYGALTLARSTAAARDGSASLRITATAAGSLAVRTLRGWTSIAPGSGASASVAVLAGTGSSGKRVLVQVRLWSSTGGQVGATFNGPWATISSASWTRVSVAGLTAPSGTATVSVMLVTESSATGDVYYADEWGAYASSALPAWTLPTTQTGPVVVYLGDSMVAGGMATSTLKRWTSLLAAHKGWLENNMSRGGTGYVKTSNASGCGLAYCPSLPEMAAEAVAARPEVVVVSAGRNDQAIMGSDPASVQKAVDATFATLRAGLPNARIIALGPMYDDATPSANLLTIDGWVKAAAAAHGATYVAGVPTWLVGHPEWISSDGVHQNDAGHAEDERRLVAALG